MFYDTHYNDCTKPYEGIPELLKALRAAGIVTAVVSNKGDKAVKALVAEHFEGCFDYALGVTEERPIKPNPDMCEYVLAQLGFDKSEAVYIGDTEVDKQTADNSGLPIIGVDWGFRGAERLREVGVSELVYNTDELYQMITGK